MYKFTDDLPKLTDIIDTMKPHNDDIDDTNIDDFVETIDLFLGDILVNNPQMYKEYKFYNNLTELLYDQIILLFYEPIVKYDINLDIYIKDTIDSYFIRNNCPRSYTNSIIINKPNIERINKLLEYYKTLEQPDQKTDEWYKFRYQGLTASSIWKALDTQCNINNIIYGKCSPLKKITGCNINSPFHNGHKYEPLSTLWYENEYDTVIGEFGCIKHKNYKWLRASPDGINIKKDNPRYGRLLEIKNPTTREISGIPKKDYWIQMQIQMEVWDLDECDFLETKFKEYENEEEFHNNEISFNKSKDNKLKGVMIMFNDGIEPIYKYCPLEYNREQYDEWYDKNIEKYPQYTWIKNIYWYLDNISCILVPRNKNWFDNAYPYFKNVWDTILLERENGEYVKRKPSSKTKKDNKKLTPTSLKKSKDDTKKLLNLNDESITTQDNTVVIQFRTQSFDSL
jgi:putative phage-type endonuclease